MAGQIHLSDHLWFQLSIAQAAVAQAFPLPFLGSITVLADPKPVRCSPNTTNHTDLSARSHKTPASFHTDRFNAIDTETLMKRRRAHGEEGWQTCVTLIRPHFRGCKKKCPS